MITTYDVYIGQNRVHAPNNMEKTEDLRLSKKKKNGQVICGSRKVLGLFS